MLNQRENLWHGGSFAPAGGYPYWSCRNLTGLTSGADSVFLAVFKVGKDLVDLQLVLDIRVVNAD